VPTIGIGAGASCDGQVLVAHDLLGFQERVGRFVKEYADLGADIRRAFAAYVEEVQDGTFPGPDSVYAMPHDVLEQLQVREHDE
jgi:3-methyl-2-oxobutanoate hydroxymethyltransferase